MSHDKKKINKRMWAWQWATAPHPSVSNALVSSASSVPVGKSAHAV